MRIATKPIKQMTQEERRAYWRETAKRRKERPALATSPTAFIQEDPVVEYRKNFQPIRIIANGLDLNVKLSPESIQEILTLVSEKTLSCYTSHELHTVQTADRS